MAKKTTTLPQASVRSLANVKPGIKVEKEALLLVISTQEHAIREIFKGALPFMEHRHGGMIMKKDVAAYLQSTGVLPKAE